MPINATYDYAQAEKKFINALTIREKLEALKEMLSKSPSHKGAENLRNDIKKKLAKYKVLLEKETKRGGGRSIGLKREGSARVMIIGTTNSGKSTLLSKITNAKPTIAEYEFTTKDLEMGIMDYNGIKIQIVEVPAITENFYLRDRGPFYLGLIRDCDLIILMHKNKEEKEMLLKELKNNNIDVRLLEYNKGWTVEETKEKIWEKLDLVYVYTKQPGKKPDFPPVALDNGDDILELASVVHKDFVRKFNYARVFGKSVKYRGQRCGLYHELKSGDIIEFHIK